MIAENPIFQLRLWFFFKLVSWCNLIIFFLFGYYEYWVNVGRNENISHYPVLLKKWWKKICFRLFFPTLLLGCDTLHRISLIFYFEIRCQKTRVEAGSKIRIFHVVVDVVRKFSINDIRFCKKKILFLTFHFSLFCSIS